MGRVPRVLPLTSRSFAFRVPELPRPGEQQTEELRPSKVMACVCPRTLMAAGEAMALGSCYSRTKLRGATGVCGADMGVQHLGCFWVPVGARILHLPHSVQSEVLPLKRAWALGPRRFTKLWCSPHLVLQEEHRTLLPGPTIDQDLQAES